MSDIGDLIPLRKTFRVNNQLVDPATVTFQIRIGTTLLTYIHGTHPQLVRESIGVYLVEYTPTASGTYYYRWSCTGIGQDAEEGYFRVPKSNVIDDSLPPSNSGIVYDAILPFQGGHDTDILSTDGVGSYWAERDSLFPDQTGNAGRVLGTDGTTRSWVPLPIGGGGGGETLAETYAVGTTQADSTISIDATKGAIKIVDSVSPTSESTFSVWSNDGNSVYHGCDRYGIYVSLPSLDSLTVPPTLLITPGDHTHLTSATAIPAYWFSGTSWQWNGGAIPLQRWMVINNPTYSFVTPSTITDAVTLEIVDAPTAGANATFTNAYALRVAAGLTSLGGSVVTPSIGTNASNLHSFPPGTGALVSVDANQTITSTKTFSTYQDFTPIASPAAPSSGARLYAANSHGLDGLAYDTAQGFEVVVGRDLLTAVRNVTGSTIAAGQAVYITPVVSGGMPTIGLAQSDATMTRLPAIGVTAAAINNSSNGFVITNGPIGMNTSAFSAGDRLYVSDTTPGALTNVAPTHPSVRQVVGTVEVSGIGNGSLLVNVVPFNTGLVEGVNRTTFSIGDGTGTSKSYQVKNAAGTGALSWNPTTNRTLTLPDITDTISTDSLVVHLAGTESITGTKTFTNAVTCPRCVLSGSPPVVALGISTGAGESITVSGRDQGGIITVNMGSTGFSQGAGFTFFTVTLSGGAFPNGYAPSITPSGQQSGQLENQYVYNAGWYVDVISSTQWAYKSTSAISGIGAGGIYKYSYSVGGW